MCNMKYILCTIFCMCAYFHAAATCSDSISDKFSYKVVENFIYRVKHLFLLSLPEFSGESR